MTPFALLINLAGLSHREAAGFCSVRLDTVRSWSIGRNKSPARVIDDLRALIATQERVAAQALMRLAEMTAEHGEPEGLTLGYPADDHEARGLGFPCVGAWAAMAARVVAASPVPVELVPRGSTLATAAAADAHEKKPRRP